MPSCSLGDLQLAVPPCTSDAGLLDSGGSSGPLESKGCMNPSSPHVAWRTCIIAEPELFEYALHRGSEFLVLASDGVWDKASADVHKLRVMSLNPKIMVELQFSRNVCETKFACILVLYILASVLSSAALDIMAHTCRCTRRHAPYILIFPPQIMHFACRYGTLRCAPACDAGCLMTTYLPRRRQSGSSSMRLTSAAPTMWPQRC